LIENSLFAEYLTYPWLGVDVENGKARVYGDGNTKISTTSTADFSAVLPDVLNNPRSKNAAVKLVGDTLTWNQVIEVLENHTGKKFERIVIPLSELEKTIKSNPNPFGTIPEQLGLVIGRGEAVLEPAEQSHYSNYHFKTLKEFVAQSK
jgi:hypothetical protein